MKFVKLKLKDLNWFQDDIKSITPEKEQELRENIKNGDQETVYQVAFFDDQYWILDGHHRVKILRELKGDDFEIQVNVYSDVKTKSQAWEKLMKINEQKAKFDRDKLELKMEEMNIEFQHYEDLIYSPIEIEEESEVLEDEVPEVQKEAISKLGDLYELGTHRVLCGDSTKQEDAEKLFNGELADMVFTDPPWNVAIGLDSNPRHRQRRGLINDDLGENFFDFLEKAASQIVNFNKGDIYCVMGCEEWPNIHKALTEAGLHWSSTIVWVKDQFVLGRSKYHRRYEPLWYGWKDKSSYVADRSQDDVWEIPRPKRSDEHPTMKPLELCATAIKNSSVKGGGSNRFISWFRINFDCIRSIREELLWNRTRPSLC